MKNSFNISKSWTRFTALGFMVLSFLFACEPEPYPLETTDVVNMTKYLQQDPERFSKFSQILELSGNADFLGTYGAYTVFAPTNEAIDAYLQEKNVSGVEGLGIAELKDLVRFHLINDTLKTGSFTDGKLPRPTWYGQYITTGAENTNGVTRIRVNRQANLVEGNIPVGNGYIHVIDGVLEPASQTLVGMLESNPDYSIFTAALKATGYYDSLNSLPREGVWGAGWYTVLAQTNEVYEEVGIHSYADLEARYSHLKNPVNPEDSLHLYVAYRILTGNKYLADIVSAAAHETLAPQEVVTTRLKGDSVFINETIFDGVLERGSQVIRSLSDHSARNGVLHSVGSDFRIKVRFPVRVYFDVADQPELRQLPTYRRTGSPKVDIDVEQIAGITTTGESEFEYHVLSAPGGADPRVFYDWLQIQFAPNRVSSMTFTTPLLVRGVYKVWIGYRRSSNNGALQVLFNDVPLQNILRYDEYWPGGFSEDELLAMGWKRYGLRDGGNSQARLVGTIVVESTAQHQITLRSIVAGFMFLDMIQFIPVNEDQLWPKVAEDGTWVYPE